MNKLEFIEDMKSEAMKLEGIKDPYFLIHGGADAIRIKDAIIYTLKTVSDEFSLEDFALSLNMTAANASLRYSIGAKKIGEEKHFFFNRLVNHLTDFANTKFHSYVQSKA
jgi:hypothetical protein